LSDLQKCGHITIFSDEVHLEASVHPKFDSIHEIAERCGQNHEEHVRAMSKIDVTPIIRSHFGTWLIILPIA